jgi:hypothetical protein
MRSISLSAVLLALAVFVVASPSVDQDKREPEGASVIPSIYLVDTNPGYLNANTDPNRGTKDW